MSSDARGSSSAPSRWLAVPAPVRQLFKLFPLHAYDPEPLPWRAPDPNPSPSSPARPRLYVFLREIDTDANDDALLGRPSFNPSCLKWQTFLRIAGVDVDLVSSNNHASPSGALPFLVVPEGVATSKQQPPLTGAKIFHYARDHAARDIPSRPSHRLEAYQALLDQAIRPAWLHALYLNQSNLSTLRSLYLPRSPLIAYPIHQSLQAAATAEILRATRASCVFPQQLLADADDALRAFSTLLGDDDWFFGADGPGLFDAEVFAYTYLLLDPAMGWHDDALATALKQLDNLVAHRARLYQQCWGSDAGK